MGSRGVFLFALFFKTDEFKAYFYDDASREGREIMLVSKVLEKVREEAEPRFRTWRSFHSPRRHTEAGRLVIMMVGR